MSDDVLTPENDGSEIAKRSWDLAFTRAFYYLEADGRIRTCDIMEWQRDEESETGKLRRIGSDHVGGLAESLDTLVATKAGDGALVYASIRKRLREGGLISCDFMPSADIAKANGQALAEELANIERLRKASKA